MSEDRRMEKIRESCHLCSCGRCCDMRFILKRLQAAEERLEEWEKVVESVEVYLEAAKIVPNEHGKIHRDLIDAARRKLRERE